MPTTDPTPPPTISTNINTTGIPVASWVQDTTSNNYLDRFTSLQMNSATGLYTYSNKVITWTPYSTISISPEQVISFGGASLNGGDGTYGYSQGLAYVSGGINYSSSTGGGSVSYDGQWHFSSSRAGSIISVYWVISYDGSSLPVTSFRSILKYYAYIGEVYNAQVVVNGGPILWGGQGIYSEVFPSWCTYNSDIYSNCSSPVMTIDNVTIHPCVSWAKPLDYPSQLGTNYSVVPLINESTQGGTTARKFNSAVSMSSAPMIGSIDFEWSHEYSYTPNYNYSRFSYFPYPFYDMDIASAQSSEYDITAAASGLAQVFNGYNEIVGTLPPVVTAEVNNQTYPKAAFQPNRTGTVSFIDPETGEKITTSTSKCAVSSDGKFFYLLSWMDIWTNYGICENPLPYISGIPKQDTWNYSGVIYQQIFIYKTPATVSYDNISGDFGVGSIYLGPQITDIATAINLPTGGGTPHLHMVVSRTQLIPSGAFIWEFSGNLNYFLMYIGITVKYYNSAVSHLCSIDGGETWSLPTDIEAKAADGTQFTDTLSGADDWFFIFSGSLNQSTGEISLNLIGFQYSPDIPLGWQYKYPRATSLQVLSDGSLYVNGVTSDLVVSKVNGSTYTYDHPYFDNWPPTGTGSPIPQLWATSNAWQSGKRTLDTSGQSGWRDATTSNTDANICPYLPIWTSRGGSHGNRGAGGSNTGPSQILHTNFRDYLSISDDGGDTWKGTSYTTQLDSTTHTSGSGTGTINLNLTTSGKFRLILLTASVAGNNPITGITSPGITWGIVSTYYCNTAINLVTQQIWYALVEDQLDSVAITINSPFFTGIIIDAFYIDGIDGFPSISQSVQSTNSAVPTSIANCLYQKVQPITYAFDSVYTVISTKLSTGTLTSSNLYLTYNSSFNPTTDQYLPVTDTQSSTNLGPGWMMSDFVNGITEYPTFLYSTAQWSLGPSTSFIFGVLLIGAPTICQGGNPNQSSLLMTRGISTDGTNKSVDDFRKPSEKNSGAKLVSGSYVRSGQNLTQPAHPWKLVLQPTSDPRIDNAIVVVDQAWLKTTPRTEDIVYGDVASDGWNCEAFTVIILHLAIDNYYTGELMIRSTDSGNTWKILGYSEDGCRTWGPPPQCVPWTVPATIQGYYVVA